jgi:hypothetical protein
MAYYLLSGQQSKSEQLPQSPTQRKAAGNHHLNNTPEKLSDIFFTVLKNITSDINIRCVLQRTKNQKQLLCIGNSFYSFPKGQGPCLQSVFKGTLTLVAYQTTFYSK